MAQKRQTKGALGKHGVPITARRRAFALARRLMLEKREATERELEIFGKGMPPEQIAEMSRLNYGEFMPKFDNFSEIAKDKKERSGRD